MSHNNNIEFTDLFFAISVTSGLIRSKYQRDSHTGMVPATNTVSLLIICELWGDSWSVMVKVKRRINVDVDVHIFSLFSCVG